MVGGLPSPGNPVQDINESWDGSSWTELADLNTARRSLGGTGSQTAAVVFAGSTDPGPNVAITEAWDGSAWTEVADLTTARQGVGIGAVGQTSLNTLAFGGSGTAITASTEEWAYPQNVKVITD